MIERDITADFVDAVVSATQAKRYGRAVCAMTPRNRFVHDLLCAYYDHPALRGQWSSGHTILSRLIKYGPDGAAHSGITGPMELPTYLLVVKDSVSHLNKRMQTVVGMTYGGNHPVESISRSIHESHAVVRNILKDSRPLIAAYLAGKGAPVPRE